MGSALNADFFLKEVELYPGPGTVYRAGKTLRLDAQDVLGLAQTLSSVEIIEQGRGDTRRVTIRPIEAKEEIVFVSPRDEMTMPERAAFDKGITLLRGYDAATAASVSRELDQAGLDDFLYRMVVDPGLAEVEPDLRKGMLGYIGYEPEPEPDIEMDESHLEDLPEPLREVLEEEDLPGAPCTCYMCEEPYHASSEEWKGIMERQEHGGYDPTDFVCPACREVLAEKLEEFDEFDENGMQEAMATPYRSPEDNGTVTAMCHFCQEAYEIPAPAEDPIWAYVCPDCLEELNAFDEPLDAESDEDNLVNAELVMSVEWDVASNHTRIALIDGSILERDDVPSGTELRNLVAMGFSKVGGDSAGYARFLYRHPERYAARCEAEAARAKARLEKVRLGDEIAKAVRAVAEAEKAASSVTKVKEEPSQWIYCRFDGCKTKSSPKFRPYKTGGMARAVKFLREHGWAPVWSTWGHCVLVPEAEAAQFAS